MDRTFILVLLLLLVFVLVSVHTVYAAYNVTCVNYTLTICEPNDTCTFYFTTWVFSNAAVNISIAVYDFTLQTLYCSLDLQNAIGFNITDPWFLDKMFVIGGVVLFYPKIVSYMKDPVNVIEITELRADITINIYVPPSEQTKWRAPMVLVVYESVNNTWAWGQLKHIAAESYIGSVPVTIDIPKFWYKTVGRIFLYSLPTNKSYTWEAVPLDDVVYITIPGVYLTSTGLGGEGSIIIARPSGEKVIIPVMRLYQITPRPVTTLFTDIGLSSATGIISAAVIAAIVIWSYKNEQDPFTGGAFAAAIVLAIGVLLAIYTGNYVVVGVGATALAALITYRILKGRGFYA